MPPSPRAVLSDIHDFGLNPHEHHRSTDHSGRLKRPVQPHQPVVAESVQTEPVVEPIFTPQVEPVEVVAETSDKVLTTEPIVEQSVSVEPSLVGIEPVVDTTLQVSDLPEEQSVSEPESSPAEASPLSETEVVQPETQVETVDDVPNETSKKNKRGKKSATGS